MRESGSLSKPNGLILSPGVQAPKDDRILDLEQEREVVEVPLGSLLGRRRSALHSNQRRAALLGLIPPIVAIDGGSAKSSP